MAASGSAPSSTSTRSPASPAGQDRMVDAALVALVQSERVRVVRPGQAGHGRRCAPAPGGGGGPGRRRPGRAPEHRHDPLAGGRRRAACSTSPYRSAARRSDRPAHHPHLPGGRVGRPDLSPADGILHELVRRAPTGRRRTRHRRPDVALHGREGWPEHDPRCGDLRDPRTARPFSPRQPQREPAEAVGGAPPRRRSGQPAVIHPGERFPRAVWAEPVHPLGRRRGHGPAVPDLVGPVPRTLPSSGPPCARPAPARRSSAVSAAVTSSGFSSSTRCPASGTTTNSASGSSDDLLAVRLRDQLVLVAGEHQRRDPRAAAPASRCGPVPRGPGRTPRSRRPGCRRSSRPRSAPSAGSTSVDANDSERVAGGHDVRRPAAGCARRTPDGGASSTRPPGGPPRGRGSAARAARSSGRPGCRWRWRSARRRPPGYPNSSGCSAARPMIVMPPIECPTSTTGPRGTRASSTAARSRGELLDGRRARRARGPRRRARAGRRRPAGRPAGDRWRWRARRPACAAGRSSEAIDSV